MYEDLARDVIGRCRSLATRSDVDAYERRLRRTRYGAVGTALSLAVVAVGAGAGLLLPRAAPPLGVEIEPNDTAAEATPLKLTPGGSLAGSSAMAALGA